jgi:hypothetical protein
LASNVRLVNVLYFLSIAAKSSLQAAMPLIAAATWLPSVPARVKVNLRAGLASRKEIVEAVGPTSVRVNKAKMQHEAQAMGEICSAAP